MPAGQERFFLGKPEQNPLLSPERQNVRGTVRFQGSLVAKPARSLPLADFLVYLPGAAVYYDIATLSGGTQ